MRKTRMVKTLAIAFALAAAAGFSGCKEKNTAAAKAVLRVGMECAYAPFNWTQTADKTPDGTAAVPIFKEKYYAYGYDVAVAKMLADKLGMELEIHKSEWSSIGISMDVGDYDCIIAGMGKTPERELAYSFTSPYYYRDNCIVVKADGPYAGVKGLSDLAGLGVRLTTQLGTGWIPLLEQISGGVKAGNYETTSECFMAVSNDVADLAIVDLPTAQSAVLTNKNLKVIQLAKDDGFVGDGPMVNVCIATRKNDTALRDKLQAAMDELGWNDKARMDALMEKAISQQPAAN